MASISSTAASPRAALFAGRAARARGVAASSAILGPCKMGGGSSARVAAALRTRAAPIARRLSVATRAAAEGGDVGPKASDPVSLDYKNVLLPVIDSNPYLSEGTKQAAATVADMAKRQSSTVTVLVVDDKQESSDPSVMEETIRWHLAEGGCTDFSLLHKEAEKPSVVVGDVADELEADLVVLSAGAVHSGLVDANLPFYRIFVADSRSPRDGKHIEVVGHYDPLPGKDGNKHIGLNMDRIKYWLSVGAQPSDTVGRLLGRAGVIPPPPPKQSSFQGVSKAERKEAAK